MKKLTSYQFWIGIASGGLLLVQWLSKYFGVNINPDVYLEIVSGVLSVFVVLGFLVPTKSQGDTTMEHILFTNQEKAQAFETALQQAGITYSVTKLSTGTLFAIESQATDIASVEQTAQQISQDVIHQAQTMLDASNANAQTLLGEQATEDVPTNTLEETSNNATTQQASNEEVLQEGVQSQKGSVTNAIPTAQTEPTTNEANNGVGVIAENAVEQPLPTEQVEQAETLIQAQATVTDEPEAQQTKVAQAQATVTDESEAQQTKVAQAQATTQDVTSAPQAKTSVQVATNPSQTLTTKVEADAEQQKAIQEEIVMLLNANKADEQQIAVLKESRELYATTCIQELETCIKNRNQRIAFLQSTRSSL